jgi:hypothetical protein
MHITLRLIVNCWNFIIIDNEAFGFLHSNFNQFDENLVHDFSHLLASGIKLVFAQCVLHLQKVKHVFYAQICQGSTKFQKQKNDNKMNKPTTIPYCNNFENINQFSNNVSTLLAHKCSFFAHWSFVDMKYWPTTHSWHATLHFHLLACFLQVIKFRHQIFFSYIWSHYTLCYEP